MRAVPVRVLLGPQNPVRNFGEAIRETGLPEGPLAVISAGWQEAENDLDEARSIANRPLEDLELYRRTEELFQEDAELLAAYRRRQDLLQEQQRLYRIRLRPLAVAARRMFRTEGDSEIVAAEQRHAIAQLRALDRHHLNRTETLHRQFCDSVGLAERASVRRHEEPMRELLGRSSGVLITGGNIAILINRLRLFGLAEALSDCNLVAWSAGAMILAEQIVLFHERMPQGRRDPEVFGAGLGLVPGCVIMPDARHRLNPRDRVRIGLMARRFSPDVCVILDNDTSARWDGTRLTATKGARRLNRNGRSNRLRAA